MRIDELEVGDVLFTKLNEVSPAMHTQIYSGDSHYQESIIHAVNDPTRNGPQQLMATGLKTADMLVYRCRNGSLAYDAYTAALRWVRYLVPYDQDRKMVKEAYNNKMAMAEISGKDKVVSHMKLLFQEHGIFRAIKYTARRHEILCYPSDGESQRGLTCTMFVILCYQAAALADHVKTTEEMGDGSPLTRISDKKMSLDDRQRLRLLAQNPKNGVDPADVSAFEQYVGLLQSSNEYSIKWNSDEEWRSAPTRTPNPRLKGYQYFPSILCWKGKPSITAFDFASAMTAGMMVDAKIATSEQLRLCMEADKVGWQCLGYLDKGTDPFDPEYKAKKEKFVQWAGNARDKFKPVVK